MQRPEIRTNLSGMSNKLPTDATDPVRAKEAGERVQHALTVLMGRNVTFDEIGDAHPLGRSQFYSKVKKRADEMLSMDSLAHIAGSFGLDPLDLFVEVGVFEGRQFFQWVDKKRAEFDELRGVGGHPFGQVPTRERAQSSLREGERRFDAPPL